MNSCLEHGTGTVQDEEKRVQPRDVARVQARMEDVGVGWGAGPQRSVLRPPCFAVAGIQGSSLVLSCSC